MKKLTEEQKEFLRRGVYYNGRSTGTWTFDAETGKVNVFGSFILEGKNGNGLWDFKGIQFGVIDGNFNFSYNKLTSLEGAPEEVTGDFICNSNYLTSLEGAPEKVRNFRCEDNKLISLNGAPKIVLGNFDCNNNNLTTLKGAPEKVGGDFMCYNNKLTSLEGAPKKVGKEFDCETNYLTSSEGKPKYIGYGFRSDFFAIPNNASLQDCLVGFRRAKVTLLYSK